MLYASCTVHAFGDEDVVASCVIHLPAYGMLSVACILHVLDVAFKCCVHVASHGTVCSQAQGGRGHASKHGMRRREAEAKSMGTARALA